MDEAKKLHRVNAKLLKACRDIHADIHENAKSLEIWPGGDPHVKALRVAIDEAMQAKESIARRNKKTQARREKENATPTKGPHAS